MKTLLSILCFFFCMNIGGAQSPIFYDIYFDYNRDDIRSNAQDTLEMVFAALNNYPNLVIEVRGHTDSIGGSKYNQNLSKRRSKSAVSYLVERGVDPKRLIAVGAGEHEPIAPNSTEEGKDNPEGRQKNRRVEFKIIAAKDAPKRDNSTSQTETAKPDTTAKDRSDATTNVASTEERSSATTTPLAEEETETPTEPTANELSEEKKFSEPRAQMASDSFSTTRRIYFFGREISRKTKTKVKKPRHYRAEARAERKAARREARQAKK